MSTYTDSYQHGQYGAIELKMTYQRNMLIANGMVLSLIASMLVTAWALTLGGDKVVPIIPGDPPLDSIIVNIGTGDHVHIIRGNNGPRPVPTDMQGWNLVPVEDTLVIEDRSSTNLRGTGLEGDPNDTGTIGFGENPIPGGIQPIEDFPEYGDFVPFEKQPEMVSETTPDYPTVARRMGIEGKAVVAALVDTNGNVREARIVRPSGNDDLDTAAVTAAFHNRYSPAIQNGRPVAVWVTYTVAFKVDN